MTKIETLEQLYNGKNCSSCSKEFACKKKTKHATCMEWVEKNDLIAQMLKVIRLGYPNTIKGEMFKEWAMGKSMTTPYINYTYTKRDENETT